MLYHPKGSVVRAKGEFMSYTCLTFDGEDSEDSDDEVADPIAAISVRGGRVGMTPFARVNS